MSLPSSPWSRCPTASLQPLDQAIPGISDRMLGERLRELVAGGLLEHHQPPQGPATYSLTDAGRSLQPVLEAIRDWWAKLEDDFDRASAAARTSAPAR